MKLLSVVTSEKGTWGRSRAMPWAEEEEILKGPSSGISYLWGSRHHRDLVLLLLLRRARPPPASPPVSITSCLPWSHPKTCLGECMARWTPVGHVQIFFNTMTMTPPNAARTIWITFCLSRIPSMQALLALVGPFRSRFWTQNCVRITLPFNYLCMGILIVSAFSVKWDQ